VADFEKPLQAKLEAIAADLDALVSRVEAAHASVPVSLHAAFLLASREDMGEVKDLSTIARSTLECILDDRLRPAIRELRALATFAREARQEAE
jgi:hypothetical protein